MSRPVRVEALWLDRAILLGPRMTLCTSQVLFDDVWKRLQMDGRAPEFVGECSHARAHFFISEGEHVAVVCIDLEDAIERTGIEVAAILVHEAVHVWQNLRNRIGERAPGSESEAYAIQYIAQELMTEYARQLETLS